MTEYRGLNKQNDQLALAQQQTKLILNAAGEGIYGLDHHGNTTFVNPAATRMLGWTYEELINQPMHVLHHHTRADGSTFPKEECPIYAAFVDGAVHHINDDLFWRKDGSCFSVEYTSTPIFENEKLCGAVVVFRDITERKEADTNLRQAYAEVARMKEHLEAENSYLREEYKIEQGFAGIVGKSNAIQKVLHQIDLVAPTDAGVLITGQSGTGKELIALAIHEQSNRFKRPLIRVNCAAIPRDLFESEFFGHIKGAFTGAIKDRRGRFELADQGTIFLDEIGEIPLELQSKLLRVLQEGQFERVGEDKTRNLNIRIIAATNIDLKANVDAKKFREDLFFRLNVFPIEAVALKNRIDDIPLLATHFISLICRRLKRAEPRLTQLNLKQLQAYPWPGNIRELQNVIERTIIVSKKNRLNFNLTPEYDSSPAITTSSEELEERFPFTEQERLSRDRDNILSALQLTKGKVSGQDGAAQLLGIKSTTLASRMKALGVKRHVNNITE